MLVVGRQIPHGTTSRSKVYGHLAGIPERRWRLNTATAVVQGDHRHSERPFSHTRPAALRCVHRFISRFIEDAQGTILPKFEEPRASLTPIWDLCQYKRCLASICDGKSSSWLGGVTSNGQFGVGAQGIATSKLECNAASCWQLRSETRPSALDSRARVRVGHLHVSAANGLTPGYRRAEAARLLASW